MNKTQEEHEKDYKFIVWLHQFIKDYGYRSEYFVELHSGEYFKCSSDEYSKWYKNKKEEYKNIEI